MAHATTASDKDREIENFQLMLWSYTLIMGKHTNGAALFRHTHACLFGRFHGGMHNELNAIFFEQSCSSDLLPSGNDLLLTDLRELGIQGHCHEIRHVPEMLYRGDPRAKQSKHRSQELTLCNVVARLGMSHQQYLLVASPRWRICGHAPTLIGGLAADRGYVTDIRTAQRCLHVLRR